MEEKESKKKRILIDVSEQFHYDLKVECAYLNCTIKEYVLQAIAQRIKKDREYR